MSRPKKANQIRYLRRRRVRPDGRAVGSLQFELSPSTDLSASELPSGREWSSTMRNRTPASLVFALGLVVGFAGPLALLAFR
jgi:hypothetical protein